MMQAIEKHSGVYYSFDKTPIYYEEYGRGEPIVLVYGIACLINHWHFQIEHFSKNYRVIAFDLRGHHKSQPVSDSANLNMTSIASDIVGLMDHLKIPSAHFMGHSFGTPALLEAYSLRPEMFKSLVFINGFSKNPIKGMFGLDVVEPFYHFVKTQYDLAPELWTSLWRSAVDNPLSMFLAGFAGGFNLKLTQFKDIEIYARGVARMDLNIFLQLFGSMMSFDGEKILSSIHCPSLIISGEKDNVTPQKFQLEFHEHIKNSELVIVPYGSHCTQLDFPEYINLKIENFLKR